MEYSLLAAARGDLPVALRLANQAVTIAEAWMKASQGGDNYLASALVPRSQIDRQLGRADDAVADATLALYLLKKSEEPGTFSCDLGHAYYTLGRALQAQRKPNEARIAFHSASENLQATLGPDHPDTHQAEFEATH